MTSHERDPRDPGAADREPGTHEGVVDSLLDLQRRLRAAGSSSWRATPDGRVLGRPARTDDVFAVDDLDLSVEAEGSGAEEVAALLAEADRITALSARIRRLERDLSGIFESVGRLAEDLDAIRDAVGSLGRDPRGDPDA